MGYINLTTYLEYIYSKPVDVPSSSGHPFTLFFEIMEHVHILYNFDPFITHM